MNGDAAHRSIASARPAAGEAPQPVRAATLAFPRETDPGGLAAKPAEARFSVVAFDGGPV